MPILSQELNTIHSIIKEACLGLIMLKRISCFSRYPPSFSIVSKDIWCCQIIYLFRVQAIESLLYTESLSLIRIITLVMLFYCRNSRMHLTSPLEALISHWTWYSMISVVIWFIPHWNNRLENWSILRAFIRWFWTLNILKKFFANSCKLIYSH